VDKKWPAIKEAFSNFNVKKVAGYTDIEIAKLLKNPDVIRHRGKIHAIIQNAQNFQAIQKNYGSFQKYIDSQDKTDNYAYVTKDLINKFKWLGPSTASTFLYTVGEDINVWEH
jgi:DNA-3-methyladenine glycosylase I